MHAMGDTPSSTCAGDEKTNSFVRPSSQAVPPSRAMHSNPMANVKTVTLSRPKPGGPVVAVAAPNGKKQTKLTNPMFDSGSDSSDDDA